MTATDTTGCAFVSADSGKEGSSSDILTVNYISNVHLDSYPGFLPLLYLSLLSSSPEANAPEQLAATAF